MSVRTNLTNLTRTPVILFAGLFLALRYRTALFDWLLSPGAAGPIGTLLRPVQHGEGMGVAVLAVPNTITILSSLLVGFAASEAKAHVLGGNKNLTWDYVTGASAIALTLVPCLTLLFRTGLESLPYVVVFGVLFCIFLLLNAELFVVERFAVGRRFAASLAEWTFPVSDLLWFRFHRRRLGFERPIVKSLPVLSYVGVLVFLLWSEVSLTGGGLNMIPMPSDGNTVFGRVPIDPGVVVFDSSGFWYSETHGSWSGIWGFEPEKDEVTPYVRAQMSGAFCVNGGFFYLSDAYDNSLQKVETGSRRVVWKVTLPSQYGPFDIVCRDEFVFAVGRKGYLASFGTNGQMRAQRKFSHEIWYPQVLPRGRLAVFSPEQFDLTLFDADLAGRQVVPLSSGQRTTPSITATEYDETSGIVYVTTLSGELLRYDLHGRHWLPSWRVGPGSCSTFADPQNRLILVDNCLRGYIEIRDLDSGKRLTLVWGGVAARMLALNPDAMTGIVTSRGDGFYRFDYAPVVLSRSIPE